MIVNIRDLDVVFITYDEPQADELFEHLTSISPRPPLRVHGVKGFDAAHKAAASMATTDRFITVDGDNMVRREFFDFTLGDEPEDVVYSFTALNTVNSLAYGNGGIKIWPRGLVLTVDTHEKGKGNDFCWTYRYWQRHETASSVVLQSPYHAFRAGYREAVKLSLVRDQKLDWATTRLKMYPPNLSRLLIWATVGADVKHGIWSIYGARCGMSHIWFDDRNPDVIRDYDQFDYLWKTCNHSRHTETWAKDNSKVLGKILEKELQIDLPMLDAKQSKWFKSAYVNIERHGLMISDMKAPNET